jgi:hypothetical protein
MLRKAHVFGALLVLVASPVLAADLEQNPPPQANPLYAPTSITGDANFALGWLSLSSISSGALSAGARLNIPLSNGWNLEPELGLATIFSPSATVFGGFAHLYKNLPTVALGIFGGGFTSSISALPTTTTFTIGGEAAWYSVPNSILGLQASFNSGGGSYAQIAGSWDYFFNPNLKGTAALSWTGAAGSGSSVTTGTLALTKRWAGTPCSGSLSGSVISAAGTTGFLGLVGFSWNFDPPGTTLYDHQRSVPFSFTTSVY